MTYLCCGVTVEAAVIQLFLKYPLKAKAECHILSRPGHELFQSPVTVSVNNNSSNNNNNNNQKSVKDLSDIAASLAQYLARVSRVASRQPALHVASWSRQRRPYRGPWSRRAGAVPAGPHASARPQASVISKRMGCRC